MAGAADAGGALIAEASQIRRERLLAAGDRPAIEAAWQAIHQRVFAQGQRVVPWKDDEDAWYGPNAALTVAAWDAALVGIARAVGVDLDEGSVGSNWTLAAALVCRRASALPLLLAMGMSQPGAGGPPR